MNKTYGRSTILADITEKELNAMPFEKQNAKIIEILTNAMPIHEQNNLDTMRLKAYFYGDQDIKSKVKKTRPEINNKVVENWAYAFVEFKKALLLGKPIQYVQIEDKDSGEVSTLNKYVKYEDKTKKDQEIYEDILVCGRGFRYNNKDANFVNEDDQSPFEIINCPVENTEVVYSSKLGNEQLFAFIVTDMEKLVPITGDGGVVTYETKKYQEITVYLRSKQLVYSTESGSITLLQKPIPIVLNEHIIHEWYINRRRISLIEIGKDLFDSINEIESLDADDLEQFVNAILVFTNAKVSEEELEEVKEMGALSISSTEGQKASVELLEQRLNSSETQQMYERRLEALHNILGIPKASDNGEIGSGDTGKAKATGQGFTSSTIRVQNDETMIKSCDKKSLKVILKICKSVSNSNIKELLVSEIDNNLQIDQRDNLLTKSQALMNLYSCDIPRATANSIINLFSDANAVTQEQERLFGKQVSSKKTTNVDEANIQNNEITRLEEQDSQEQ